MDFIYKMENAMLNVPPDIIKPPARKLVNLALHLVKLARLLLSVLLADLI
jgi:hypothetical protein